MLKQKDLPQKVTGLEAYLMKHKPTEKAEIVEDDQSTQKNEAEILHSFYDTIPHIIQAPLCEISSTLLNYIAICIEDSLFYKAIDWIEYAEDMGVEDNDKIMEIGDFAYRHKIPPLFVAFRFHLRMKTLKDIIDVLFEKPRLDVLYKVKKRIIAENHTVKHAFDPCLPSAPAYETNEDVLNTNLFNKKLENERQKPAYFAKEYANYVLPVATEKPVSQNEISKSLMNYKDVTSTLLNYDIAPIPSDMCLSDTSNQGRKKTSVLIMNANSEYSDAQTLAIELRKSSFSVEIFSDMESLFSYSEYEVIENILKQKDFIVPILSQQFLEQIKPRLDLQSDDGARNRLLFQFLRTEYLNNNGINIRVRPVMAPSMQNRTITVKRDPLLRGAVPRDDVPKLVSILLSQAPTLKLLTGGK